MVIPYTDAIVSFELLIKRYCANNVNIIPNTNRLYWITLKQDGSFVSNAIGSTKEHDLAETGEIDKEIKQTPFWKLFTKTLDVTQIIGHLYFHYDVLRWICKFKSTTCFVPLQSIITLSRQFIALNVEH